MTDTICKICNNSFSTHRGLSYHITQKHNISIADYYAKYIDDSHILCNVCGKPTKFYNIIKGYSLGCCREHTNLLTYGTEKIFNSNEIRDKIKQTNLQKYGVENVFASEKIKQKLKDTWTTKYGVDCPAKSNQCKEKSKQTCRDKYGVDYSFQSTNNKEKSKKTMLQKYGVDHNYKRPEIIENSKIKSHSLEIEQKRCRTKSKNHSLESYMKDNLIYIYEEEYFSEKYPFCCDVYIPDLDLYIEINNHWVHCDHFYDSTDPNDIIRFNKVSELAKTNKYYANCLKTWTIKDIQKRDTAMKNYLNYVVLWNKSHIDKFLELLNQNYSFTGFIDFNNL